MLGAATVATADLYKSTDASGRVQYSDRPPPGATRTAPSASAASATPEDLQGRWRVANVTLNGELYADKKTSGATWTIRGNEVTVESGEAERFRYALAIEPGSKPRAFRLTPIAPTQERAITMIYERDGDRLRIAYFDGREARPTGFAPERKLVVTTLIPTDASGAAGASPAPRNDPCAILRAAGADAFLGGARILTTPGTPDPSASCKVEDAAGLAVTLLVVRAATPSILERERAKAVADSRNLVQEEALGAGAFSSARGNHTIVWAQKGDTLVALAFIYPPSNRERLAQFARRVLAEL